MSLLSRITNVFRPDTVHEDIDAELQSHLEEAREHGRNPGEASRAFGSPLLAREAMRDSVVAGWLDSLLKDAIFGRRQLLKHKTASIAAILSLGLAIGSSTAAFRLIDALLLRPLPVSDPARLYVVSYDVVRGDNGQKDTGDSFDYPGFRLLRTALKNDAELMAISYPGIMGITYGTERDMERAHSQFISGWTFAEFGLKPALGRLFTEADDVKPGAHPVAVLSFDYWSRRLGKDPNILGRSFRAGNDLFQIVGVAPEGFTGTETGTVTDIFIPTMMNARAIDQASWNWFRVWVRLRPSAAPDPQREIDQYLSAPLHLEPAASGKSGMQKTYRRALSILAVLVALVLLIACANVANLMIAQAASRISPLDSHRPG